VRLHAAGASCSSTPRSRTDCRGSASSRRRTSSGSGPSVRRRAPPTPRLAYEAVEPRVPERPEGDVRARLEQRALELEQSLDVLTTLLDGPIQPAAATPGSVESIVGAAVVESARGATLCVVERDGGRLERVRLRTGSYANWPSVAYAAADNLLPDFPLINKSFELCYACADR
jgi:Ni,Fe-hydrogenase III large subunit